MRHNIGQVGRALQQVMKQNTEVEPTVLPFPTQATPTQSATPREAPVVLHVRVVTGAGGGPDKTILRSASYMDAEQYRLAAAYIHPENDLGVEVLRDTAERFNCPLYLIPERHAIDFKTVQYLLALCRKLDVAIWHGHDYKSDLLGVILARFHPMKLVATTHGFTRETWRTKLYYHIDNLAMRAYQHVAAVSPQLADHCRSLGIAEDRVSYVPNGIEPKEYPRTRMPAQAKRDAELNPRRLTIGVIGRLSTEKGVDRAIEMFSDLAKLRDDVDLHIVGDGPQAGQLKTLTLKKQLTERVHWWGWQADTRPHYEMFDLLLLPSHTEGLPNVVLEAMLMGVPVAATDVGGVRDLLDEGRAGSILGSDVTSWSHQIHALLSNTKLRMTHAALGRKRVLAEFTFSKRMERIRAIYDAVLAHREGIGETEDAVEIATPTAARPERPPTVRKAA